MGQASVSLELAAKSPVKGGIKLLTRPGKNDKVSGELNVEVWLSDVPIVPCATQPGSSDIEKSFIQPLWEGRFDQVINSMHPLLQKLIDPTIFEARFRHFKARLGHCTGSEGLNIAKSVSISEGVKTTTDAKKLHFERGTAQVKIECIDNKIIEFDFTIDGASGNELPDIPATDLYARGIAFFKLFFDASVNIDEPYALLSEAFRQQFDKEKFQEMRKGVQGEKVGKTLSIAPRTANAAAPVLLQSTDVGPKVVLEYTVEQECADTPEGKRTLVANITWVLCGFQMHIFGFFVNKA